MRILKQQLHLDCSAYQCSDAINKVEPKQILPNVFLGKNALEKRLDTNNLADSSGKKSVSVWIKMLHIVIFDFATYQSSKAMNNPNIYCPMNFYKASIEEIQRVFFD